MGLAWQRAKPIRPLRRRSTLAAQSASACLFAVALVSGALLVGEPALRSHGAAYAAAAPDSAPPRPTGPLTLAEALRLTASHQPLLAAAAARVRVAEARRLDAGRALNPTLSLGVENFGGSLGTGRTETSLGVEQLVELGGDRSARGRVARSEIEQAGASLAGAARDAQSFTADRFFEAWSLQERVGLLWLAERLAVETITVADERYRAGATPIVERMRAEGARALRATERRRAEAELTVARRRVAAQWGSEEAIFDSLILGDPHLPASPSAETLLTRTTRNPDRRRAAADVSLAEARVALARAARVPDLTVGGGVRHLEEAPGTGFITSLAVPLPIWNARQGGVRAAEAERSAAQAEQRAVSVRLREAIRSQSDQLQSALGTFDTLAVRIRPAAQNALDLIRSGYRAGRFGYLDVLDAQRSLIGADLALIDATADAWRARITLEQLVAAPLDSVVTPTEER